MCTPVQYGNDIAFVIRLLDSAKWGVCKQIVIGYPWLFQSKTLCYSLTIKLTANIVSS